MNYYSQTNECKERIINTCLEKYGVTHVMKVDEIKNRGVLNSIKIILPFGNNICVSATPFFNPVFL